MRPIRQQPAPAIVVFTSLNLVLAGLSLVWALMLAAVLVSAVFFPDDKERDVAATVVGSVVLGLPGVLGVIVYSAACLGLMRRRAWGYYFHLGGAVLAAFTCLGVVYTILAFLF